MASLLDIGPLTEEVDIHGHKLTIHGLTAGHLFQLFSEFPDMRKLLDKEAMQDTSPQQIMLRLAPELIAKIIALAAGTPREQMAQAEAIAMSMGADDQLDIIAAVQRLSFKEGIAPFVDRVTKLLETEKQTTTSPGSDSSTTKSPVPFSAALQTDSPPSVLGRQRRAN